jgi:hypothetical protein
MCEQQQDRRHGDEARLVGEAALVHERHYGPVTFGAIPRTFV